MAVDANALRARWPEFNDIDENLINTHLADAALQISPGVWGAKADLGVLYLAAHSIALSPAGRAAKLVGKDDKTTYGTHFARLQRSVTSGYRSL